MVFSKDISDTILLIASNTFMYIGFHQVIYGSGRGGDNNSLAHEEGSRAAVIVAGRPTAAAGTTATYLPSRQ